MNPLFQKALKRTPQPIPPIWMMRQAGRYHQHYQNLRKRFSFMDLCKQPELAAETALGPIIDFDFDVSILFSDLLFPLEALGMGLSYPEGRGPELGWHLKDRSDFDRLVPVEEALPKMEFQKKALQLTRERLPREKSLIGFVGGPWTLFSYACQGRHDGNLIEAKRNLSLFSDFLKIMVPFLVGNIKQQLEGGAEVVMVFDTAAGELSPSVYQNYVWPGLQHLVSTFPEKLGYYAKNTTEDHFVSATKESLKQWSWAGLGFDHKYSISKILKASGSKGFIQGNFDQSLLFSEKTTLQKHLSEYLRPIKELSLAERAGWVSGLGHGVLPKTPESSVKYFVERIREEFAKPS
jgi:uroporphyrinogen decarboxylase